MSRLTDPGYLEALFTSSGGPLRGKPFEHKRLAYCFQNGFISCREVYYEDIPEPDPNDFARRTVFDQARRGRGTEEHKRLKWLAWNWCVKTYGEAPVFECKGQGDTRHDLVAHDAGIIIECGSTNPRYAYEGYFLDCISGGFKKQAFALFPKDLPGLRSIIVDKCYIFSPTKNGKSALECYDEWVFQLRRWYTEDYFHEPQPKPTTPPEPANLGKETDPFLDSKVETLFRRRINYSLERDAKAGDEIAQFRLGELCRDNVDCPNARAHMLFSLALRGRPSSDEIREALEAVSGRMTAEEIDEAQKLEREWLDNEEAFWSEEDEP